MHKCRLLEILGLLFQRVKKDRVGLFAAQASFFLMISFVPLLVLLVTLVQFIIPLQKEDLLRLFAESLPQGAADFVARLLDDLFSQQTASIISLSFLVLLFAASRGVHSVILGLRHIFRTPKSIYYKERLRSLFFTLAFLLTVLFALTVLVFGSSLISLLESAFPFLAQAGFPVGLAKYGLSLSLITLFSLLIYSSTAKRPLGAIRAQLPGALFTSAGWSLFSGGFSLYMTNFSNYSYLYGSLAAIVLLMLWLYFCMWLLFLGAELNVLLHQKPHEEIRLIFEAK